MTTSRWSILLASTPSGRRGSCTSSAGRCVPSRFLKPAFSVFAATAALLSSVLAASAGLAADEKPSTKVRGVKVEDLALAVPEDWVQQPPANKLRLAQFEIPKAEGDSDASELVVSHFGGGGGGAQANVERWVQQFLPKERAAKVTTGTSPQGEYIFVDITGTYKKPIGPPIAGKFEELPNARMLGVIINIKGKGNYFLKLAGPSKSVSAAVDALRNSFGGNAKDEKEYKFGDQT